MWTHDIDHQHRVFHSAHRSVDFYCLSMFTSHGGLSPNVAQHVSRIGREKEKTEKIEHKKTSTVVEALTRSRVALSGDG